MEVSVRFVRTFDARRTRVLAIAAALVAAAFFVAPAPLAQANAARPGYVMVDAGGHVYALAGAHWFGNVLNSPMATVAIERTPSGNGYWIVNAFGQVYAFGDAAWFGNANRTTWGVGQELVVGIVSTTSGHGYWLFTNKGRVIPFGDAHWFGQIFPGPHNGPIIGAAGTPLGNGYDMVGADGAVYAYGAAAFHGSATHLALRQPLVSVAVTATGSGYWLVASDGGVFAYGVAFRGSAVVANAPMTIGAAPFADGYIVVDDQGAVHNFSSAATAPSLPSNALVLGITGIAANN
jgi:hypothetical protein